MFIWFIEYKTFMNEKTFCSILYSCHDYVFDGISGLAIKNVWFLHIFFNNEFEIMMQCLRNLDNRDIFCYSEDMLCFVDASTNRSPLNIVSL